MPKTLTNFYRAHLKNNCPECYNMDGLELLFHQEWQENIWSKKATNRVTEVLSCNHCKADIYPVNWTEDIERVYAYHMKLAKKETYFKLKPLSWIIIALCAMSIAAAIYFGIFYK